MQSDFAPADGARSSCGSDLNKSIQMRGERMRWLMNLRSPAAFLDIIFASFDVTPRNSSDTFIIESRNQIFPFCYHNNSRIVRFLGGTEHVTLNGFEEF